MKHDVVSKEVCCEDIRLTESGSIKENRRLAVFVLTIWGCVTLRSPFFIL